MSKQKLHISTLCHVCNKTSEGNPSWSNTFLKIKGIQSVFQKALLSVQHSEAEKLPEAAVKLPEAAVKLPEAAVKLPEAAVKLPEAAVKAWKSCERVKNCCFFHFARIIV